MKIIPKAFYSQYSTIDLAKALLGKYLAHESVYGVKIGKIVETEAYLFDDPASHSFKGLSVRNSAMFEEAGTSYVYLIYGMYYCFNVVSNKKGLGEAVLIRALEPVKGLEGVSCSGPGKLCKAMGIDRAFDGHKLWKSPLYLAFDTLNDTYMLNDTQIVMKTRVGITKASEEILRFYIKDNKFISRK
jgi:DNA-3-methyladenine glycosylase